MAQQSSETRNSADKRQQLNQYLRKQTSDGEFYFKSRFIADEVDLSPSEISAFLIQLQEAESDLIIEDWAGNPITWRVDRH